MKLFLSTLTLLASVHASAATFYVVDGKIVNQGAAEETARKSPQAKIIKISATYVAINPETGNFKKFADIGDDELKKAVSSAK